MDSKPLLSRIGTATIILLILIGMVIPLGAGAGEKEPNEPNDAQGAATQITGDSIDGEISMTGGTDWFSKEYTKGETINIVITKKLWEQGLQTFLHAPNGTQIDNSTIRRGVDIVQLSADAPVSGRYGVQITGMHDGVRSTEYTIHTDYSKKIVKTDVELASGVMEESEPNNNNSNATQITKNEIVGAIEHDNSADEKPDYYAIQVDKGERISVLLRKTVDSNRETMSLYQPREADNDLLVRDSQVILQDDDSRGQSVIHAKQNGTVVILITGDKWSGPEPLPYRLEVSSFGHEPLPSEQEPTPTQATATAEPTEQATETPSKQGGIDIQSGADSESPNSESATTELFGPGFTGSGAIVALLLSGLFGWRRS
ncbi:hypothetical protein [Halocatena halophila]|uniref:hypothetical protein n=1 Tax=Halocatena halophila TaxID=2814576 RepID=UPI002ED5E42D